MLEPITIVTLKPQFRKIPSLQIQAYIQLCYENFPGYSDNLIQLAVFHYLELELYGGEQVIERTGDRDMIKFQPLKVTNFWEQTQFGRMFQQLTKPSRSFQHLRP